MSALCEQCVSDPCVCREPEYTSEEAYDAATKIRAEQRKASTARILKNGATEAARTRVQLVERDMELVQVKAALQIAQSKTPAPPLRDDSLTFAVIDMVNRLAGLLAHEQGDLK